MNEWKTVRFSLANRLWFGCYLKQPISLLFFTVPCFTSTSDHSFLGLAHGLSEAALLKVSHVSFKVRPHGLSSASASLTYLQIWQSGTFLTKLNPFLFCMLLFCPPNMCSSYCPVSKNIPWNSQLKALLHLRHLSPRGRSWEPRQQSTRRNSFFGVGGTTFISFPHVTVKAGGRE